MLQWSSTEHQLGHMITLHPGFLSLTRLKRRTRDGVADDTADIGDSSDNEDDGPSNPLASQSLAELVKEGQEGEFDGPKTGPEEGRNGELQLHVRRRNGDDVGWRYLQPAAYARDRVHQRHREAIQDGARGEEEKRCEDQGVV